MAHLPRELLGVDPFAQPKTLFLPAPGTRGILVTRSGSRFRSQIKRFEGPQAALTWCIDHQVGLVFWHVMACDRRAVPELIPGLPSISHAPRGRFSE
jgi:hypothetical protein